MSDWREFDYDRRAETAPPPNQLVYVHDVYNHGVSMGLFDGDTFRMWWGSDDCSISHWAPIEWPDPPADRSSDE
jgi:hypothetical protein